MESKIENGELMILINDSWRTYQPRQTRIVESHDFKNLCVVREDYMEFEGSNVYAIDDTLNIVWEAELPHISDIFANILVRKDGGFETSTWNGILCHIDLETGKTTKLGITK